MYRVLIVDNSGSFSDLCRSLMQSPDRSVEVCDSVSAAQNFLRHFPVDVAILHLNRAGNAQNSLARLIIDRNPRAQVVVCSNHIYQGQSDDPRMTGLDKVSHLHSRGCHVLHLAESSKLE